MERKVKNEMIKMLIPIIGSWWVLKRLIPSLDEITWWDTSSKSIPIIATLVIYQGICWVGWKVFYMMYYFDYTFDQVFTQW